jgi:lipopolysaccharide export system protein LptA
MWIVLIIGISFQFHANAQDDSTNVADTLIVDTLGKKGAGLEDLVEYHADDIRLDVPNKVAYLYGNARVQYQDMDLKAAFIRIDFKSRTLFAKGEADSAGIVQGKPDFVNGGQAFNADSLAYNFDTKRGRLQGIRMQQGEGFVYMNKVFRNEEGHIFSDKGYYTTCNHENPHFYINTRKLKLIPNNKVVFGPSNLVVEGIPTPLVIPFGIYPTTDGRSSGLKMPEIGLSALRGYNVRGLGYYFGISDYMDMLIEGDFYFRGSWGLRTRNRYMKKYKYSGTLNLAFTKNILGEQEDESFQISEDFRIRWNHSQDRKARPGTTFTANVDVQNSEFSKNNSRNASEIVQNEFMSSISYGKVMKGGKYNFTASARHNQNTSTHDISVALPNLAFNVARGNPFERKQRQGKIKWYEKIGVSYSNGFDNRVNTDDTLLFSGEAFDEFKYGMRHSIPVTTTVKLGYFTLSPRFNYNEVWYLNTIRKYWDPTDSTVKEHRVGGFERAGNYNMAMGLQTNIFGTFRFKSKKIIAIRHVVSPTLSLNYSPDFSTDKFGYYRDVQRDTSGEMMRYSIFEGAVFGGPGMGENGSVGLNIGNYIELKKRIKTDSGSDIKYVKLLEAFSLSTNYNFMADSFHLSMININARTTLFKKLNIQSRLAYDPYVREDNTRKDKFEINKNGRLARMTSAGMFANVNLSPEDFKRSEEKEERREVLPYYYLYSNFVDFSVPWSLGLGYNLDYNPLAVQKTQHSLNFQGDVSLTDNWKVSYSSGYVLHSKEFSFSRITVHRQLHCWEFLFSWIPVGFRQEFSFTIHPKAGLLNKLELKKRRDFQDL